MKTLLLATVAMACSVVAAKAEDGFSFGLYGGATLETETDHQLFGPNGGNSATSSLGEGTWAGMDFRYHSNGVFLDWG
ncbi:MAG: hypothetical protein GKR99_13560 [Rhodobacteraceae bacterium]|nr:hypothetical protein [Paracoccaceae bacterium]